MFVYLPCRSFYFDDTSQLYMHIVHCTYFYAQGRTQVFLNVGGGSSRNLHILVLDKSIQYYICTPLCRLCGRLDDLISEPTRAVGATDDSGDCDPYWPAEKGQVATTQSADGCTYIGETGGNSNTFCFGSSGTETI